MKKLVVIFNLAIVLLSSCATQKKGASAYNDDVYANPKDDRIEDARLANERRQAIEAIDKRYNDSIAAVKKAQKDKDDANPYYKDREFKYDDYYDYEYATRVKRFDNNISGLSYYDNYYTNSYWYNQNPYNYGVSVYNGYSWWGSSYNAYSYNPSVNFYSNYGWGCNSGYGYNGYNPYMQGYNNGYNNGYFGNPYGYGSPYGYGNSFGYGLGYGNYGYGNYGYGSPYGFGGNGYNNGWGYYNSYDNNSSYTYGPRSSHGGGNSRRSSNPGGGMGEKRESYSDKYLTDIAEHQIRAQKFTDIKPLRNTSESEPVRVNNNGTPIGTGGIKQPHTNSNPEVKEPIRSNTPVKINEPIRNNPVKVNEPIKTFDPNTVKDQPIRVNEPIRQNPVRNVEPVKQQPIKQQPIENTPRFETPDRQQVPSNFPTNNGGGSTPSNNGGGHRPR